MKDEYFWLLWLFHLNHVQNLEAVHDMCFVS